jgi:hypothetical protein
MSATARAWNTAIAATTAGSTGMMRIQILELPGELWARERNRNTGIASGLTR